jgi:hypothetical protein
VCNKIDYNNQHQIVFSQVESKQLSQESAYINIDNNNIYYKSIDYNNQQQNIVFFQA